MAFSPLRWWAMRWQRLNRLSPSTQAYRDVRQPLGWTLPMSPRSCVGMVSKPTQANAPVVLPR